MYHVLTFLNTKGCNTLVSVTEFPYSIGLGNHSDWHDTLQNAEVCSTLRLSFHMNTKISDVSSLLHFPFIKLFFFSSV